MAATIHNFKCYQITCMKKVIELSNQCLEKLRFGDTRSPAKLVDEFTLIQRYLHRHPHSDTHPHTQNPHTNTHPHTDTHTQTPTHRHPHTQTQTPTHRHILFLIDVNLTLTTWQRKLANSPVFQLNEVQLNLSVAFRRNSNLSSSYFDYNHYF